MNKFLLMLMLSVSLVSGVCHSADAESSKAEKSVTMESVSLNKADLEELQSIRGLGAKKAQAIIEYREANGPFTDVKQLLNVKGIGEKFLSKNANLLRL
ncbi:ComEA family DNA-binding protein [Thalassotalea litorea]|uniref:ComEA family DNA-binding protein n=1 Tax=Thalassotalea litorea TaxID=2020715 RepID=UPI003735F344